MPYALVFRVDAVPDGTLLLMLCKLLHTNMNRFDYLYGYHKQYLLYADGVQTMLEVLS